MFSRFFPDRAVRKIGKSYREYREFLKFKNLLERNKELRGAKHSRICYLIGNGPSIASVNLKKLADKDTFVLNSFWRHVDYVQIRPKNYLVVETPDYSKNADQSLNYWEEDLSGRNKKISEVPETKLFFPIRAKKYIEDRGLFKSNDIYYLFQKGFMNPGLKFNLDITKPIPFTKNTVIATLFVAVYMGFETIYLLGCEHDFLAHPAQHIEQGYKHFYTVDERQKHAPHPFEQMTYEDLISSTLTLFRNYRYLQERLSRDFPYVRIYNATPNSFLDVFPAIDINTII